jgi:mono/diheme cytochrome c family protein
MRRFVFSVMVAGLLAGAPAFAQDAAKGVKVFQAQKCSLCHSVGGVGNKKGPLDGVGTKLTADEVRAWIITPKEMTAKTKATRKPDMKAYPNLPKEELEALVAYVMNLKKK